MPRLSLQERLQDPDYRARSEKYIKILKERGGPKADLYQAMLESNGERTNYIHNEITETQKARDEIPLAEQLKDPAFRERTKRFIALEWQINPANAAFMQAMMDGETEKANNIMRQKDLFTINRMLNDTTDDETMKHKALSGWKQNLLKQIKQ